jgi:hypothetical protein
MNARSFDRVALVSLPQSLARIPSCERSKARCILDLGCSRDNPIQRDVVFESKLTRQQLPVLLRERIALPGLQFR